MKKEESSHWVHLAMKSGPMLGGKKDEAGKQAEFNDSDPQASLMQMMKNLYDTGDDNMKRTISESFAKAQSGQLPGPGAGAAKESPPGF